MRMRKKKHGDERIDACAHLLISKPSDLDGIINLEKGNGFGTLNTDRAADPASFFPEERRNLPVYLEIGCGKGDFICGTSSAYPNANYVAMELIPDVACLAMEKAERTKDSRPDNVRFVIGNAKNLFGYFLPNTLDGIYLNFSDPWPKKGHAKRRLTHRSFLAVYRELLKDGGILKFKTDNASLFDFSMEEFEEFGLEILWQTRNLHASEKASENITTEYERNFSAKGFDICSAWVRFKK